MIRPLRRRHLQIWSALCVLIPAGIVTAWFSIKRPLHNGVLQPAAAQALPNIIFSVEQKDYVVRLRSSDTLPEQLEWINKNILTVPSAVIYETVAGGEDVKSADLIGRIEAKGNYYFPLQRNSIKEKPKFILYDFIHEEIIDSLNFRP
ncbi:MAG: hypothetical protein E6H10_13580 [Bacteroidetes bacterium]|nr:MAG: hypothetical protein E6H10_13580 [Bacteroidota bacterium]